MRSTMSSMKKVQEIFERVESDINLESNENNGA